MSFFADSVYFGVVITLLSFWLGRFLQKKTGLAIVNPLLISVICIVTLLCIADIDYQYYYTGAKYISYLLTPATVCLAIPLYRQMELLKKNWKAIAMGIISGLIAAMGCIYLLSLAFGLGHAEYVTMLPKSVTNAIGVAICEELGGHISITVAAIVITGLLGNIFGPLLCRLFRITDPIAQGLGIGASSHAMGTAKAIEMGEIQGAVSSLSLVITGILTVGAVSVFSELL